MRTRIVMVCVMLVLGCTSTSEVKLDLGEGKVRVMRTMSNPHMLVSSPQISTLEDCEEADGALIRCRPLSPPQYTASTGWLAGLIGPALYSGAIAYSGHAIGRGLGKSGDIVNQEQGNGQVQGQAQEQAQRQHQRQSQGQSQHQSQRRY